MNAIGHLLDFRRTFSHLASEKVSVFLASEIYLQVFPIQKDEVAVE